MTLSLDWGAAGTLMSAMAAVSVPITAYLIGSIIKSLNSETYTKKTDFVELKTEFHGFVAELGEMKEWLCKKLESIDKKLDR